MENYAILDDEKEILLSLKKEIKRINKKVQIDIFTKSDDLIENLNKGKKYDAYFLDIFLENVRSQYKCYQKR